MTVRTMRSVVLVAFASFTACTRAEKGPDAAGARREPATDAASAPAPAPRAAAARDLTAWTSDWPKSWTDSRVLAALAEDCDFVPTRPTKGGLAAIDTDGDATDLFSCTIGYEQACTIDPCIAPSSTCQTKCTSTCTDCGGTCAAACKTCKSTCQDDACKRSCAKKCGECKQTCTRTMDRCVTGDCARTHDACTKRFRALWARSGCKARCGALTKCRTACDGLDACNEQCDEKVSPGFKACRDRCDEPRNTRSDAAEACLTKCYETMPCAPPLCEGWTPGP